jgi:hypothetical protein
MSPAGRPPLSDSRKSNRLFVMLTDAEREQLDSAAAVAGKPTSTWARDELLQLAHAAVTKKSARKKS